MVAVDEIFSYIPGFKATLYFILGKFEGDWTPTEEPENFENEENVETDCRDIKYETEQNEWKQGKDISEQINTIVNNKTIVYRPAEGCLSDPITACVGMFPPFTCLYIAYAEWKVLRINFFMAIMKTFLILPFWGCFWCYWPLKTVIRELQEGQGSHMQDMLSTNLCVLCTPFTIFANSWTLPEDWIDKFHGEIEEVEAVQECHECYEEKIHLD